MYVHLVSFSAGRERCGFPSERPSLYRPSPFVSKCKTILILIQSTSSSLELAMGSRVLRLVDVSLLPNRETRAGWWENFAPGRYTTELSGMNIHDLENSAGAIILTILLHQHNHLLHQLYTYTDTQTPGVCALSLFLRRSRKMRFSFGKTVRT